MEPVYIGIGIKKDRQAVILLTINRSKEKAEKSSKKQSKNLQLDDYIVVNMMTETWVNEFQWWALEHDIMATESKEIIKVILENVLRRNNGTLRRSNH